METARCNWYAPQAGKVVAVETLPRRCGSAAADVSGSPPRYMARQLFLFQEKHSPSSGGQFMGQQASGRPGADNSDVVKGLIAVGQLAVSIILMGERVQVPIGFGTAMLTIER